MHILSVQSSVAFGHVGNAAAVFPLQRLGAEVTPVNTTWLSNHPAYPDAAGGIEPAERVAAILAGVERRGAFGTADALLTGYLGDPGTGPVVLAAAARLRTASPRALWCCDPVIGDDGAGIYVRPGLDAFFRDAAVPAADLLTPNHFELKCLTAQPCASLPAALLALQSLRNRMRPGGPRLIFATSMRLDDTPEDALDCLALGADGAWRLRTPRVPATMHGTGDVLAGLVLFHTLAGAPANTALERAVAALFGLVVRSAAAGSRELLLAEAQQEIVAPTRYFSALPC